MRSLSYSPNILPLITELLTVSAAKFIFIPATMIY